MWLAELDDLQRRALLGLAYNVVVSDGLLDPNEEGMIAAFRREMALDDAEVPEYLELEGIEQVFGERRARCIAVINLLMLSYADGAFEIEEECLLKDVSTRFEMDEQAFLLLDNWVRRYLVLMQDAETLFRAPGS
jgi:tellurite resistance protein